MKRFVVREAGRAALPALDLDGIVTIGSGSSARVRLPAQVAREVHARIEGDRWEAFGTVRVGGEPARGGAIGDGVELAIGDYVVRIEPAPASVPASTPQRTESLARELVRGLLGDGAAPVFEVASGPGMGSRRELPPPEAKLVIGRGDEADWVILDEDLSREHAEIRRGWDGVTIRDMESKNGTQVDGRRIAGAIELHDGARIELGNVVLVFRDPAERHLRGDGPDVHPPVRAPRPPPTNRIPIVVAAALGVVAALALAWVLAS